MFLAVHFCDLQLQCRALTEPAILVCKDKVVQSNPPAQQTGIKPGMGLASAAALCNTLAVFAYDEQLERQLLQQIAQHCYQRTGDIILCGSDCLIFATHSMRMLYPDIEQLFEALQGVFRQWLQHYRYGCAPSIEAAEVLARAGTEMITDNPVTAQHRLEQLPVSALRISSQYHHQLARLGLDTIGQLLALPKAQLRQRFPYELLDYITRLQGQLGHVRLPKKGRYYRFYQPRQYFQRLQELNFEIDESARLLPVMTTLCERLCAYLRQMQLHTQKLQFSFYFRELPTQLFAVHSVAPQGQLVPWLTLVQVKLETLSLDAPVIAVQLTCEQFSDALGESQNLFDKRQQGLAKQQLLGVLHARLGAQHCYHLHCTNAHIPEYTQVKESPLHSYSTSSSSKKTAPLRPNFLLEPQVLSEQVCLLRGPERIQSHWWQQQLIERDYYIGENAQGQLCWLFKDKHQGWFVQGYFA